MQSQTYKHGEKIFIVSSDQSDYVNFSAALLERSPETIISTCQSIGLFRQCLENEEVGIIVLDYDLVGDDTFSILQWLRLHDSEPSVIVVSKKPDLNIAQELFQAGCQGYFVKEGEWVPGALRAVSRIGRLRKLQEENRRLIAKLTDANFLLEDKNKRLDEFCATVAHDIRSPLANIIMRIEYVLDVLGEGLSSKIRDSLFRTLDSAERLTNILQVMYDFAKLGSKAAKMDRLDLNKLLHEVIADLALDNNPNVVLEVGDLPDIWGNDELIRRVLLNLIQNAIKYNDKENIIIRIACRGYSSRTLCTFATIIVSDNGPGISQSDKDSLFSLFSRGKIESNKEGLGVGLATVKRILEVHNGNVFLESKEGEGATFVLEIPTEKISLA